MTYNKLTKECMQMYAKYKERDNKADMIALNTIVKLHNAMKMTNDATTWLWTNYLESGDIDIIEALRITNLVSLTKKVEVI